MSKDTKTDKTDKTETEKIKITHDLQKLGMPSKVAAKLAGIKQEMISKFIG